MGTCSGCQWWGAGKQQPPTSSFFRPPRTGEWFSDVPTTAKACGCPALLSIDQENEGYSAVRGNGFGLDYPVCDLVTGPDFGCVQWRAKEKTDG